MNRHLLGKWVTLPEACEALGLGETAIERRLLKLMRVEKRAVPCEKRWRMCGPPERRRVMVVRLWRLSVLAAAMRRFEVMVADEKAAKFAGSRRARRMAAAEAKAGEKVAAGTKVREAA
jgi:hypothetical protein